MLLNILTNAYWEYTVISQKTGFGKLRYKVFLNLGKSHPHFLWLRPCKSSNSRKIWTLWQMLTVGMAALIIYEKLLTQYIQHLSTILTIFVLDIWTIWQKIEDSSYTE